MSISRSMISGMIAVLLSLGLTAMSYGDTGSKKEMTWADRMIKMKDKLGLTDDQITKIRAQFDSSKAEFKTLGEKTRADMKIISEKLKAGAGDDVLKPLLDNLSTDRKNI